MPDPRPLRRPRRSTSGPGFVQIPKTFERECLTGELTLEEIGLLTLANCHPETKHVGALYRPNEWADEFGGGAHVGRLLDNLQAKGKIVLDGYWLLIRGWLPSRAFKQPKFFSSGLYSLVHQIESPLLRMVIGTELLGLRLCDQTPAELEKSRMYQYACEYWEEITGCPLIPAGSMTGDLLRPPEEMLDHLAVMPGAEIAFKGITDRSWSVIDNQVRAPLQRALLARFGDNRFGHLNSTRIG
ncbi:hypothetical protein [Prescottella equi]